MDEIEKRVHLYCDEFFFSAEFINAQKNVWDIGRFDDDTPQSDLFESITRRQNLGFELRKKYNITRSDFSKYFSTWPNRDKWWGDFLNEFE